MHDSKHILLLTLVHPILLPPVYATAQVLREEGYNVDIVCFAHIAQDEFVVGNGINVDIVGTYTNSSLLKKIRLQYRFKKRAFSLINTNTTAIISFCSFSYLIALNISENIPVIYSALEISEYNFREFLRAPLSVLYRYLEIKKIHKAAIVATPSVQRSAWLAGKANMKKMPTTVLNTSYISSMPLGKRAYFQQIYEQTVPSHFLQKKVLVYTGNINDDLCIKEVIEAFCETKEDCCLVMTGMKDNEYCDYIRKTVEKSTRKHNVLLLPFVPRDTMVSLQMFANIGLVFFKERPDLLATYMAAPNKAGEYLSNGLFLLGNDIYYLQNLEKAGVATLSKSLRKDDILAAISNALRLEHGSQQKIENFVKTEFNMKVQMQPFLHFLKHSANG